MVTVRCMYGSVQCMCEHRTDPYMLENTRRIIRSLYVARTGPGDDRECTYELLAPYVCLRAFYGEKKMCIMPRSHIHRAPHDCSCPVLPGGLPWILETVGLPCEFNFCRVCGHISYHVRAVPLKNWKSLIVRRP